MAELTGSGTASGPSAGGRNDRSPTMTQIAREARVSVSTVSKVLSGHTDVSAQTRRTVERVVAERGYQLPRAARSARRPRIGWVDFVINELDSAWGLSILAGVNQVVEEAGLPLVLSTLHNRQSLAHQWIESLLERSSRGVILVMSEISEPDLRSLRRRNLPLVCVEAVSSLPTGVPSVSATNSPGGAAAAQHLLALGHRRIAAIGGPPVFECTRARMAGFCTALSDAGHSIQRQFLKYANFQVEGGRRAAHALLTLPTPPTAIFAGNDQQAIGTYEAARSLGLRIPHDVSVVGFDDLEYAPWLGPALTTVRQPLTDMGAVAARTLLRLVNDEQVEQRRIELSTQLVVRDSTAPPAACTAARIGPSAC